MQKTTTLVLFSVLLILSAPAEARSRHSSSSSDSVQTHQSGPDRSARGLTIDLGLSSNYPIPMSFATGAGTTSVPIGSLTAIFQFAPLDSVQILAGIPTTQGGFTFGLGGIYKRTIVGNESAGLHLGGGISFGTVVGNFTMAIPAVVGLHYEIAGTDVSIHVDGGGAFGLLVINGQNGIGGTTVTNFALGPMSGLLGASIVYAL